MRTRTRVVAAAVLAILAIASDLAAARPAAHRLRVSRVVDLLRGEPKDEYADWALVAFDGPDAVVGVWSAVTQGEPAVAWRRADVRTGELSRTTRVELPARVESVYFDGLVVGQDGVATVSVQQLGYREDALEQFGHLDTEILQFSREGALIARLSIAAPAEIGGKTSHVKLFAHDGVVDMAYSAQLTRDGDRAVWWRRLGAGGAFVGDPVRLSAPALSSDPVVRVGIWDVFLGVDSSGAGRVLHRRVTFRGEPGEAIVEPPELFWTRISPDGVASASVSLGVRDDEAFGAAFAPSGAACVMRAPAGDSWDSVLGTSFLEPLLLSPEGATVALAGPVVPQVISNAGEFGLAVGADEDSVFHLGSIASDAYRGRIDLAKSGRYVEPGPVVSTLRRIPSAVFAASLGPEGDVRRDVRGVRLGMNDAEARLVAADGTLAVAGFGRGGVSAVFVTPRGETAGRAWFRLTPGPVNDFYPVLASTGAGESLRFAVAWSSHIWMGETPSRRFPSRLRVAVVR